MPIPQPSPVELREAQAHFGFLEVVPIRKDWYVVHAMQTMLAVDHAPFRLVFAGGTCLARAHRLVSRMSEDVDFKVVPTRPAASHNQRRQALGRLRDRLVASLTEAGFALAQEPRSRDANQYTVLQLHADSGAGPGNPLRPTIQIELSHSVLREPTARLPVASFVNQAYGRPPEISEVECVSIDETAAEKAVSLTRRTAMEISGVSRMPDPALVRHLYDLHMIRDRIDRSRAAALMREIAVMDAQQFGQQHPAYRDDIAGQTRKALVHLATQASVRARYDDFAAAMVYGEPAGFDAAIRSVRELVDAAWTEP